MKKVLLSLTFVLCTGFLMTDGYSETKTPVKQQTELFVHSSCFP